MMILGCDFHPRFQQIAFVDQETGEYGERRLCHPGEAEQFYRSLAGRHVRIGVEATENFRWFRQLMDELGHEFLLGDAAAIRAACPRRQKTDKRDARHILNMLVEDRFPSVWQPGVENDELRQLLLHRCRMVRMRARVKNQVGLDGQKQRAIELAGMVAQAASTDRNAAFTGLVCVAAQGSAGIAGRDGQANRASGQGGAGGS
jgi:transposase